MPSTSKKQADMMSAIAHGWQPPDGAHLPGLAVAKDFHAADKAVGKWEHAGGGKADTSGKTYGTFDPDHYADGGSVNTPGSWEEENKTQHYLNLISHAADSATIRDSHRLESRFLAGLASQAVGLDPQGRPQLGRRPGLVDETLAIPSGVMPLARAGVSKLLGPVTRDPGTGLSNPDGTLDDLRQSADRLLTPPDWSDRAAARADALHHGVQQSMQLSDPHGFLEHMADAAGTMAGQLPIPGKAEVAGAKGIIGGLRAIPHAVAEWLGPTIRPSAGAYGAGSVAGGTLGALGDAPVHSEGDW